MATLDVLTLAEAKDAIQNNADTNNDGILIAYITAISAYLDGRCGPIVQRTITDELHDGGECELFLAYRPVISVTTVTEAALTSTLSLTEQTFGTAPTDGFLARKLQGRLTRMSSGSPRAFADGEQNVKVTYLAGRSANTAAVEERFKRAAGIILSNIYRREFGQGTAVDPLIGVTYIMPNAAKALLADDLQIKG